MTDPSTEILNALLEPDDDRAWKVAVGATLGGIHAQTVKTNGRVSALERDRNKLAGGLIVIGAIVVPLFLQLFK
jgi:hypothetical protein